MKQYLVIILFFFFINNFNFSLTIKRGKNINNAVRKNTKSSNDNFLENLTELKFQELKKNDNSFSSFFNKTQLMEFLDHIKNLDTNYSLNNGNNNNIYNKSKTKVIQNKRGDINVKENFIEKKIKFSDKKLQSKGLRKKSSASYKRKRYSKKNNKNKKNNQLSNVIFDNQNKLENKFHNSNIDNSNKFVIDFRNSIGKGHNSEIVQNIDSHSIGNMHNSEIVQNIDSHSIGNRHNSEIVQNIDSHSIGNRHNSEIFQNIDSNEKHIGKNEEINTPNIVNFVSKLDNSEIAQNIDSHEKYIRKNEEVNAQNGAYSTNNEILINPYNLTNSNLNFINNRNLESGKFRTFSHPHTKKFYESLRKNPYDTSDSFFDIKNEETIHNKIFNNISDKNPETCLSEKLRIEKEKMKEKKYIEEMINYNVETLNSINKNIQNIFSENNFAINRMKKFRLFNSDKELSRIIVASDLNNLRKKRIIYKIRIGTIRDFFNGIFKGFKSFNNKGTKVIKNGKIYNVIENYRGYFICQNLRKGIDYDAMLNLKLNLKNFDYSNYENSVNYIMKLLRDLVCSLGNACTGINDLLEIIESKILKMRKIRDNDRVELVEVERLKNSVNEELEKLAFENAGLFLGKILGYTKLFQQ